MSSRFCTVGDKEFLATFEIYSPLNKSDYTDTHHGRDGMPISDSDNKKRAKAIAAKDTAKHATAIKYGTKKST